LLGKEFVLADIGRDHFPDLARFEQRAEANAIDAGIVGNDGQILGTRRFDRGDQCLGDAAEAEAARHYDHAIFQQSGHGRACVRIDLLQSLSSLVFVGAAALLGCRFR
jgi:hypothetical protein